MPIEPGPCAYVFPSPAQWRGDDDVVALGADLRPSTLIEAYRSGLFPMPNNEVGLAWFSPVQRGVLPLDGVRVSRSLRRTRKRFEITVDQAFGAVMEGCADRRRSGGWINSHVIEAYTQLHRMGWAHSVEAWREGRLVGGLYGVEIGGLFAAESKFSRETDASKAAVVALVEMLKGAGPDGSGGGRLLDVQWKTEHLATLGVEEIPREVYLERLKVALGLPPAFGERLS